MPLLAGVVAGTLMLVAVLVGVIAAVMSGSDLDQACQPSPVRAHRAIPAAYLALYVNAGREYGIGWHVLAAVGKIESDHGRGTGPGITSGTNHAGAAGPMQFLSGTWAAFGVDGDRDGDRDVYDPADAIPAAARYLKHEGAPQKIRRALFAYNHSDAYVDAVLRQARRYAHAHASSTEQGAVEVSETCSGADSFAAAPTGEVAATVIAFARAQLGKPYGWGAEGPRSFDCSGLTYAAYRAAAITIPRTSGEQWRREPHIPRGSERPGDLVFFNSGPGTSNTNPGHVGLVIAPGKMIAAPHSGTVIQIQSYHRSNLLGFARPAPDR